MWIWNTWERPGGWTETEAATVQAGGVNTMEHSNISYVSPQANPSVYALIDVSQNNWQHLTRPSGCTNIPADRVYQVGPAYMTNLAQSALFQIYHDVYIVTASSDHDSAIFYDGTADWFNLNGTGAKPCNVTTGSDWNHLDYATKIVAPFLKNIEGESGGVQYLVNENGETDTSVPQAAETVRAMIGVGILGVKLEAAGHFGEDRNWRSFEDDAILGAAEQWKSVWAYANFAQCPKPISGDAPCQKELRMQGIASTLLTYYDGAGVWWTFTTDSGFAVMPEVAIVPTAPATSIPSPGPTGSGDQVENLVQAGGGYGREWGHCYVNGVDKGACAVFVTTDGPKNWPTWSTHTIYQHTMVLHGSDIADGGTITIDGSPPPSSVPASTGIVAFQ